MKVRKVDFHGIAKLLEAEGWRTPNTYDETFAPIPNRSGIYTLVVHERLLLTDPFVGYVGKSSNLRQRLTAHPVVSEFGRRLPDCFIQRWFLTLPQNVIASAEIAAIRRFNPRANSQHKGWFCG